MNNNDILQALAAARTFKPTAVEVAPVSIPVNNPVSFVSMFDQLDRLDQNTFNVQADKYK